ncbi:MAG: hypothetical protein J6Q14_08265 [Oscillospiraceae bacterium]|nr:hypothetical protein [Oscillospiraceae bacterium]
MESFESFDIQRLDDARDMLFLVYSYYYDYAPTSRLNRRLGTIISKLDELIRLSEEERRKTHDLPRLGMP